MSEACLEMNAIGDAAPEDRSHNFETSCTLRVGAPLKRIAVEEHDKQKHSTRPDIGRLSTVSGLGASNDFWRCTRSNKYYS